MQVNNSKNQVLFYAIFKEKEKIGNAVAKTGFADSTLADQPLSPPSLTVLSGNAPGVINGIVSVLQTTGFHAHHTPYCSEWCHCMLPVRRGGVRGLLHRTVWPCGTLQPSMSSLCNAVVSHPRSTLSEL